MISFYAHRDQFKSLQDLQKRTGRSQSALLREAMDYYLLRFDTIDRELETTVIADREA
jgi:predicted DNA-binding protein